MKKNYSMNNYIGIPIPKISQSLSGGVGPFDLFSKSEPEKSEEKVGRENSKLKSSLSTDSLSDSDKSLQPAMKVELEQSIKSIKQNMSNLQEELSKNYKKLKAIPPTPEEDIKHSLNEIKTLLKTHIGKVNSDNKSDKSDKMMYKLKEKQLINEHATSLRKLQEEINKLKEDNKILKKLQEKSNSPKSYMSDFRQSKPVMPTMPYQRPSRPVKPTMSDDDDDQEGGDDNKFKNILKKLRNDD